MITLYFGTTDTDLTTGRTKTHAAIHAQMTAIGLGDLFPAAQTTKKGAASDAYDPLLQTHLAFEIPGSRLAALAAVPAPYKAASAREQQLDPGRPGTVLWKQDATGVMFQPTPPRFPKAGIVT
jgi:hypothetical protein